MILLGKLKIYELAKELGATSKEILAKATELGIKVASHLSNIDEEQANKIRKEYKEKTNISNKKE